MVEILSQDGICHCPVLLDDVVTQQNSKTCIPKQSIQKNVTDSQSIRTSCLLFFVAIWTPEESNASDRRVLFFRELQLGQRQPSCNS